jgi:hypothetical protein
VVLVSLSTKTRVGICVTRSDLLYSPNCSRYKNFHPFRRTQSFRVRIRWLPIFSDDKLGKKISCYIQINTVHNTNHPPLCNCHCPLMSGEINSFTLIIILWTIIIRDRKQRTDIGNIPL